MLTIDLTGKRALVTGGNSGIGAAIATCLADAGADVAINYLVHPEAAEQLAGQIRDKSRRAMTLQADVSQPSAVQGMFQALEAEWSGIDILVNNAGVDGRHALGWEVDVDAWRKVIEINLFGAFYCAREALHRMVPQRSGVIVNMSSVHEQIPWSGYSAYTASKAGVSMLTKTLAQEAAPHGVRVVAIAPGAIQTAINHSVWSNAEGLADLERKIPMGRMGKPEEIAGMVAMIASGAGSYLTGTTVFVDGGMMDFADFAHGG